MKFIFDTVNIYYLPQYQPVAQVLMVRGHEVIFLCYANKFDRAKYQKNLDDLNLVSAWVDGEKSARAYYQNQKADWVFYGNSITYEDEIHSVSKTAQLGHGIGPKRSYYWKSVRPMTVRFMEGAMRFEKIKQLYPFGNYAHVGYAKLDSLFKGEQEGLDFERAGLDRTKKTLLYAPTFAPSSIERFPDNWPEKFSEFNILVKPHSFTFTRERYSRQRKKIDKWRRFENVYVAEPDELSLLPFMKEADLLMSEASSTLFEFVALDRPVVVCDFYKVKWSYRGPFRYRFAQRYETDNTIYKDIGRHVDSFKGLKQAVVDELAAPETYREQRKQYVHDHVGPTDGLASERIADYLENYSD